MYVSISEKNKLWLKWKKTFRVGDGRIELSNAELYGPVTHDYVKVPDDDFINLDFTNHFLIRPDLDNYYVVKLSWDKVGSQEVGSIKFDKLVLEDVNVGLMDKLQDSDLLLIDCKDQTDVRRQAGYYKMNYDAYLCNSSGEAYEFTK